MLTYKSINLILAESGPSLMIDRLNASSSNKMQGSRRSNPIKILSLGPMAVWDMGEGSGHRSVYEILKGFIDRGHEVHHGWHRYLFGQGVHHQSETLTPQQSDTACSVYQGIHLYRFDNRIWLYRLSNWLTQRRLYQPSLLRTYAYSLGVIVGAVRFGMKLAAAMEPDIVYGHQPEGAYAAYVVARRFHLPNITRIYGSRLYPILGKKWQLLREIKRVGAYWLPCTKMIMTNDGTHGDAVMRYFGVPAERSVFWRNGVDDIFDPTPGCAAIRQELGLRPEQPIVLMACRLEPWKRVDRLIRAAPLISASHPETAYVVLGSGSDLLRLQALVAELGVQQHFQFVGQVVQAEVKRYMNCATVFCSLADLSSAANPLFEALMCGRCVVAVNTGNARDLLQDGKIGWVIPPDDTQALANVIIHLLENQEMRHEYERAARAYALEHFYTWQQRAQMEVDLVEQLVDQWRPKRIRI